MIEERNIYMTDKFLSILKNTGYIVYNEDLNANVMKRSNTYFSPPMFVSESDNIFCDTEGYENTNLKEFHDFEYLYDVPTTYKMRGKCHKPLRHNVNIFSNRIDSRFNSDFSFKTAPHSVVMDIHKEWVEPDHLFVNNKSMMMSLLYNHIDEFSIMPNKVFYLEGEPVAFVLYDESPKYTHLFLIYAVPTVEYLTDYVTWSFFRQKMKDNDNKFVNYGGIYGDSNIKKDKDRLCPYVVRNRWSWRDDRPCI